jgi:hypothetical protein
MHYAETGPEKEHTLFVIGVVRTKPATAVIQAYITRALTM